MPSPPEAILVIAYNDDSRSILTAALTKCGAASAACATFAAAEELALSTCYSGLLIDLPAIVKAKGEEKIIACTLASFFPTLRVRVIGAMLVPMTLAGDARQDNSLGEFLDKSCTRFTPRRLRLYRRRQLCVSTLLVRRDGRERRGYTLDISWGGAFITDSEPERYTPGEHLELVLHEFGLAVDITVRWVRSWGIRQIPGIGVSFDRMNEKLEQTLKALLRTSPELDRDRLSS
ncbi:PilZ domain-containing protein [Trichlorobacter ammonificans]|uniref:PilZ domain-containing protein n=1 Tax=Trichlorobacter ammonificans TaxID=2916410 RepID=A0ABM9D8K3_9BACT|nr:PilZ domain-containing protein [Trichlorobacter ammonificans]CAH2030871.1 PilZ domain-containing protein [Trichlorobacter ammonificans]